MVTFPFSLTLSEIGMSQLSTRPFADRVSKYGAGFRNDPDELRRRKSPAARAALWLMSYGGVLPTHTGFTWCANAGRRVRV
jgi:hypothetical protein